MGSFKPCNFCYRGAVTVVRARRNTVWRMLTKQPPRSCNACVQCLARAYRHVNGKST